MKNEPRPDSTVVPIPAPDQPGVLRAGVDVVNHAVTIDFDPRVISDEGVRKVAEKLAPVGHQQYCKTLLHLGGRASGAAEQKLERKAQKIEGIRRARATFMGGVMTVTFDDARLSEEQVIERVRESGAPVKRYEAEVEQAPTNIREWLNSWTTGDRLELVCMVLTFVFMVTGWITAKAGVAWHDVFYLGAYLAGGYFGVRAGLQSLRQWTIDVDLLMVLAAIGAAVVNAPFEGAMLLFLFSLSNVLQDYAIDRTRKAIKSLMKLRPDKALVRRDGSTVLLPVEDLVIGDVLVVRPGESIALDSVIIEGSSAIDQASLTGESMPVAKKVGDPVFAGTINQTGGLEIRVTKLAKDSTIEKLVRMVEEAQTEKADTQRFLDRAEQFYAAGVILFTLGLIVVPILILHEPFQAAFYRAMTVMVVASPCALIISTPASILSAIGGAARRGVLFKGGVHLERAATIKVVTFDKTGTLTEGKPRVTDVVVENRVVDFRATPDAAALALLGLVGAVEVKSEHPLAQAIVTECQQRGVALEECAGFQSVSGQGASGLVQGRRIAVGNARYFTAQNVAIPETFAAQRDNLQNIVFAIDLARHARRVIYQNLGFAMVVIVILIITALGFKLPLPIGVVGHEGSTVLVCLNGLRMLTFRSAKR